MSHEKRQTIKDFIQKNALQISVQLFGLVFLFLNLWLSSQLSPMVKSIDLLSQRVHAVEAIEKEHIDSNEYNAIIKRIDDISNRLDRLIERTR